jgi:hypothetical protein
MKDSPQRTRIQSRCRKVAKKSEPQSLDCAGIRAATGRLRHAASERSDTCGEQETRRRVCCAPLRRIRNLPIAALISSQSQDFGTDYRPLSPFERGSNTVPSPSGRYVHTRVRERGRKKPVSTVPQSIVKKMLMHRVSADRLFLAATALILRKVP